MKTVRFLSLFCLLFLTTGVFGKLPLLSHAVSEKIESVAETAHDFLWLENVGYEPMSQKNEAFVKNILEEMGIKRKIVIRKFSNKVLPLMAQNACAIDCGFIVYLFFDENYFNLLRTEEKKYLARHEVAHIQRLHVPIKILSAGCLWIGLSYFNKRVQGLLSKKQVPFGMSIIFDSQRRRFILQNILVFVILYSLLKSQISRICEYDADLTAVRCMDSVDDSIMFIDSRIKKRTDKASRFFIKRIINKLRNFCSESFSMHPSWEHRKQMLKVLEKNKKASLFSLLMKHFYNSLVYDYNPFSTSKTA